MFSSFFHHSLFPSLSKCYDMCGSRKNPYHPQTVYLKKKTFLLSSQTGLAEKKLNRPELALDCFFKLQAILKNHPQVLYQIASMYPFQFMSKFDSNIL